METRLLLILCLVPFLPSAACGQAGSIVFRNWGLFRPEFPGSHVPFFDDEGKLLTGTDYLVQTYGGPALDQLDPWGPVTNFVPVAFYPYPGYFGAGITVLIGTVCGGCYAWVQLRAWAASGGGSFEEAARNGAWTGTSTLLRVKTGNPGADPPELPTKLYGIHYPGSPMLFDPPISQLIRAGESATLSVTNRGDLELFYHWYGGARGDISLPIASATNATFTTPILNVSTSYWVKVYYSLGTTNIARVGADVTVYPTHSVWLGLSRSSSQPVITINGVKGQSYRLESSPELGTAAAWTTTAELTLPSSPFNYTDTNAIIGPRRFYRAVALGP